MKNKIAVIMQSPDLGGAETYMISLVKEFRKNNSEIVIATNSGKYLDEIKKNNFNFETVPYVLDIIGDWKGFLKSILIFIPAFLFYIKLLRRFKKNKIELILMSGFSEKMLVTFLSIFFRIPVFWIEYSVLDPVFKKNFYLPKFLYLVLNNFVKKIIVPTNATYEGIRKSLPIKKNKLSIISCGIEINEKKYKIPPEIKNKMIIGNVSRLTKEKGQDILIRAIPEVIKQIPNAIFMIVGDGPDRRYYEQLIKELGVFKNVRMPGFVVDVNYYYSLFDIFVFPTVWNLEGFGLVAVEAMSKKVPVIGSSNMPVPEIVIDNSNGIIVPKGDSNELAKAVIRLCLDEDLRKKLGLNGYRDVYEKYDIKIIAKKFMDLFENESNYKK